ncbi:hypothetical protein BDP55DRAFT_654207, partial [Colletotrichum godetiae]
MKQVSEDEMDWTRMGCLSLGAVWPCGRGRVVWWCGKRWRRRGVEPVRWGLVRV